MDSLSKKIQNLGIHDFRNAARFAQNVIVQYEPYQVDVRRASNTDSWGPTPKHLAKVLRHRYQVPLYLITEYVLKRLLDHIAAKPKNFYERARKDYVNYGSEWRVVLKCLVILEHLLLNVDSGDEVNQVVSCLVTHKHILTREVAHYKVRFSNDGKMEIHERGIKKKNEVILQLIEDPNFLKRERIKNKKNLAKIQSSSTGISTARLRSGATAYNANDIDAPGSVGNDFASDDEDEDLNEGDFGNRGANMDFELHDVTTASTANESSAERQRRQRREILRDQIKIKEQQRKQRAAAQAAAAVPNLIDLDDGDMGQPTALNGTTIAQSSKNIPESSISSSATTVIPGGFVTNSQNIEGNGGGDDEEDDDDYGEFQSEISKSTPTGVEPKDKASSKDAFADLFESSKSLI